MPHLTIETSIDLTNEQVDKLLYVANSCLFNTALFKEEDIKSRLYSCRQSLVGLGNSGAYFTHMRLEIMEGRSAFTMHKLMADLNKTVENLLRAWNIKKCQVTTQISDLHRELYQKATI